MLSASNKADTPCAEIRSATKCEEQRNTRKRASYALLQKREYNMVFSSLIFLYLFLPVCLLCYGLSPSITVKNGVLTVFSLIFYAWGEPVYILLLLASVLVNYLLGLGIGAARQKPKTAKFLLIVSLMFNIGLLLLFKYSGFLAENLNRIPGVSLPVPHLTLPIGISFYTFQILSYIIDLYWDKVDVQRNPLHFLLYISMFPQLIAGPIVRYSTIEHEIRTRKVTLTDFSDGMTRLIVGLAKKVILANHLSVIVENLFGGSAISVAGAWYATAVYAMQIYFDFSGYSDMAIGMGKILGYDFPENFNLPYTSASIREFWRRWHMTLASWFRDYLYIPLGGSRSGNVYLNTFLVFLCTGLWHGAAWTYVLWGAWHGLFMIFEIALDKRYSGKKPAFLLRWLYCIVVVNLGLAIFRSDTIGFAWTYMKSMLGFPGGAFNYINMHYFLHARNILIFFAAAICSLGLPRMIYEKLGDSAKGIVRKCLYPAVLVLFAVSLVEVINGNYSPFIYFRF